MAAISAKSFQDLVEGALCPSMPMSISVDLHGYRVKEAKEAVQGCFKRAMGERRLDAPFG